MPDDFTRRVRTLAGLADDEDARRVATAVLGAVGDHLTGASARALADGLPEPIAQPLAETGETAKPASVDEFYADVERRSGLRDAPAAVGAVLRTLAETADAGAIGSAREQLPDALRALLQTDEREAPLR
jgi:uncharacterized protein (DUF2267 family)